MSPEQLGPLTPELVIDAAMRLIEEQGVEAFTMRRLSDELGAAVTAIYWHVGNRDTLLDAVVDGTVAEIGTVKAVGSTPRTRIASLCRSLRNKLLDRPHLIGLAHQRSKVPAMFQPVQAALAAELSSLGLRGADAAVVLLALQVHVTASVVLQRTAERGPTHRGTDPDVWPAVPDDPELVRALSAAPDYDEVFEFGLNGLLNSVATSGARRA